ncbi:unnamed protein product, partial [Caretta caretta]
GPVVIYRFEQSERNV